MSRTFRPLGRERHRWDHKVANAGSGSMYYITGEDATPYPLAVDYKTTSWEDMLDVIGSKKKTFFNPCFHDNLEPFFEDVPIVQVWNTDLGEEIAWQFPDSNGIRPRKFWEVCRELPSGITESQVSDFNVRAEHHFKTAIDVEVLTYNLLLDTFNILKQFNGLFKTIKSNNAKYRDANPRWRDLYQRRFAKRDLKRFLHNRGRPFKKTSDSWLIYNFAVKPTLKDLRALADAHKKVTKRLKFLRKVNGNVIVVDYREGVKTRSFSVNTGAGSVWPLTYGQANYVKPPDSQLTIFGDVETQLVAHAAVKFDIDVALLYSESAYRWAMAVYMGLLAIGSTIWEGIPFSFVIDWFLDEKMKSIPNMLDYSPFKDAQIFDVYHSVKSRHFGEVILNLPPQIQGGDDQVIALGSFVYKSYMRQHGYPNKDALSFRIPWSGYLASLAAALILQRHGRK